MKESKTVCPIRAHIHVDQLQREEARSEDHKHLTAHVVSLLG